MRFLRVALVALVSLAVLIVVGLATAFFLVFAPTNTVDGVDFERPLAIPPLAESRVDADGTRVFELAAQAGATELLPGTSTETWGFNGSYLGPTLRAERGEKVRVEVRNDLDEATSVHWHGMHLPAEADGGPHQPVAPGQTWAPSWRIDQPAATLWYHPHPHGQTQDHVNRGLAGMFILDDHASDSDGESGGEAGERLPSEYGVDDVPVVVQDKQLDEDGQLGSAELGDDLVVNGTYGPYLDVTTEKVRLRLLNASVQRVYSFGFSDDREFSVIGTDGGLLPAPAPTRRVLLSPGERAEVVVSMSPGEDVVLRSFQPDLGSNFLVERFNGGEDTFDVLQLRASDRLAPSPPLPTQLATAPELDLEGAVTRSFELQGRGINGRSMEMSRVDLTVKLGATEVWEVTNTDGEPHNLHVHDVQYQVLSVDGEDPDPVLAGWKDTIFLPPGRTVRLAMRFTDYADSNTPYMFHCHLLPHEDAGMMGQFVIVKPGQQAAAVQHSHH